MSDQVDYTDYHPRWLRPRASTYWWLQRWSYVAFIVRELSCVFIAWFVAYLLLLVQAVSQGAPAYQQLLAWSGRPFVVALNIVTFAFVVFHSVTWFNLAPKAMVVKVGRTRMPALAISGSNYLAWALASALVAVLVLGG